MTELIIPFYLHKDDKKKFFQVLKGPFPTNSESQYSGMGV